MPAYFEQNDPLVAISAIGQDNVLANPMQMALVAATVANGGTMMQPQLVKEIRDPRAASVRTFDPPSNTGGRSRTRPQARSRR